MYFGKDNFLELSPRPPVDRRHKSGIKLLFTILSQETLSLFFKNYNSQAFQEVTWSLGRWGLLDNLEYYRITRETSLPQPYNDNYNEQPEENTYWGIWHCFKTII